MLLIVILLILFVKDGIVAYFAPTFYSVAEIIFLITIIGVFYYTDLLVNEKNKTILKLEEELNFQKSQYSKRESQLLSKIMKLEEKEREEQLLSVHKKKTIQKIVNHIDTTSREDVKKTILPSIATVFELVSGILYWYNPQNKEYEACSVYGLDKEMQISTFIEGDGFCGQAVKDHTIISVDKDRIDKAYFEVESGLGHHKPQCIYFIPIIEGEDVLGLLEIGLFKTIDIDKIWPELNLKLLDLLKL
jgi:hypothetical protein